MKEQYHHERDGQKYAMALPYPGGQSSQAECYPSHQERHAQIRKGMQGKILHVSKGKFISAGMRTQRLRDVSRCRNVAGDKKESQSHQPSAGRNQREHPGAARNPDASGRHGRTQ